jgi:hypothetical protein
MTLALAAGLLSCDDGSTGPQDPDAFIPLPGLTVSDPTVALSGSVDLGPATAGWGAFASATANVSYVSACPGTFPDAETITVTNRANGRARTVEAMDGGFDPVALEADPGDELELLVQYSDGGTSTHVMVVPASKRPGVVRTVPPKSATEIALTVTITVVFTEPVNGSTLTPESFQLVHEGGPVEGTLRLSHDGLRAEFQPAEPLRKETTYDLVITTGVLDLDGEPLEEAVQATFTTGLASEVELCAKQAVVDEINGIQEPWPDDYTGWQGPTVNSTGPSCGVSLGLPGQDPLQPRGTFTYTTEGRWFDWQFTGEGFYPSPPPPGGMWHNYTLIVYPGPWPGADLVCLHGEAEPGEVGYGDGMPDSWGNVRWDGRHYFGHDLSDARIWIVRRGWVDCTGSDKLEFYGGARWNNPDGVPRLTNDLNDDGEADASWTLGHCLPDCDYGEGALAYDWLFETALINYRYVSPPGD